jgi:hypothetical protein
LSDRNRPVQTDGERPRAVERLKEAVSQQSRLRDEHEAATDTRNNVTLGASLLAAGEQVAARERWLRWVDDHHY